MLKRLEEEELTPLYIDIQRAFQHKKQTLKKTIDYMKKKSLMLREVINHSQQKLKEVSVYSKSSNLVIRRMEAAANQLMLSIYNPIYHKRKVDEEEYLIPVNKFEEEVQIRANNKHIYFDVVFNMRSVNRVKICTSSFISSGINSDEDSITKQLINLGELKLFDKLKQIYGVEKDVISLLEINNLVNFKLVVSSTLQENVNKSDPMFNLIVSSILTIEKNISLHCK